MATVKEQQSTRETLSCICCLGDSTSRSLMVVEKTHTTSWMVFIRCALQWIIVENRFCCPKVLICSLRTELSCSVNPSLHFSRKAQLPSLSLVVVTWDLPLCPERTGRKMGSAVQIVCEQNIVSVRALWWRSFTFTLTDEYKPKKKQEWTLFIKISRFQKERKPIYLCFTVKAVCSLMIKIKPIETDVLFLLACCLDGYEYLPPLTMWRLMLVWGDTRRAVTLRVPVYQEKCSWFSITWLPWFWLAGFYAGASTYFSRLVQISWLCSCKCQWVRAWS